MAEPQRHSAGDLSRNGRPLCRTRIKQRQAAVFVREAANSLHIGKSTAADALEVLQQRGFVVPITKGAFSRKVRHATEWRLTEFPCDVTHALPSKEFARWSPEIQNTVRLQTSTVPETGPIGTCSRTEAHEKAPDGTCSRTVEPQNPIRYLWPDTNSLPGAESSDLSLFLMSGPRRAPSKARKRGRPSICPRVNRTRVVCACARRTTALAAEPRAVMEMQNKEFQMSKAEKKPVVLTIHHPNDLKGKDKLIGGSMSDSWNDAIAGQVINSIWTKHLNDDEANKSRTAAVEALIGIKTQDEIEGMIAAQIVACHNASNRARPRGAACIARQVRRG